ncbi:hypothetical protein CDD82_7328 [Ophiocordyceps australis]|uniref:Protein kinase domain-containing protein n=1 Tax=Ophiocordyceps australis TaxID=1399860 RepID=A0A2C5XF42_9HYPO|nr:hypothetical protein CDD82_7328 [Ophiocordyceps australis]
MSTALQTATHRPATLASPAIPSSSTHQYSPTHSSPSRDLHSINPATTATSSPNRRPPSRRTSVNSASPQKEANPRPSRGPPVAMAPATDNRPSTAASASDRMNSMPPVAPPRTSSSKSHATSSRRSYGPYDVITTSQSHAQAHVSRSGSRSDAPISHSQSQSQRSKRAVHPAHLAPDGTTRPSSSRSSRASEVIVPVRAHHASTSRTSRETNESLHRSVYHDDDSSSRDARAAQNRLSGQGEGAPSPAVAMSGVPEERRGTRSRHDHSRNHKGTSKFGDFILGNTIGEGEFGKVKLGWKQDSNVQVAIKLIKRDTVGGNPSRLGKIRREVTILRGVEHPSIVRLIDMLETDRYIGIILEYASGGELFDYILNNRYLRDPSARRLFAQLVSGVGYLHKKGIVHRDLKLENLLLDRHRNIIITDFGFANTFDADEELTDEDELNLTDRDYVKRLGLDSVNARGMLIPSIPVERLTFGAVV